MAVLLQGNGGVVADVGGTTNRALKIESRPAEYGTLGHYRAALQTGAMAANLAADSEIFHFRWTDATRLAVIQALIINGFYATTAFAVGATKFVARRATAWTAQGGGGSAVTVGGNEFKMRSSMGTTLMASGDLRIATTAALTVGTKTLTTNDVGMISGHSSAGVGGATPIIGNQYLPIWTLMDPDTVDGQHPIVLAQNEGLVIRATVPGTGVWTMGITIRWAEVAAY